MSLAEHDRARVSEDAALWLHRLRVDDSQECRTEFDKWIRQGALHLEEFLFAQAVWKELDGLDSSFVSFAPQADKASVVDFPSSAHSPREAPPAELPLPAARRKMRTPAMAAGLALLGVCATLAAWVISGPRVYSTGVGSQEAVKLADGSVIHLNTRSKVKIRFSDHAREVQLVEGEALFTVTHDVQRPFVVSAGDTRIRALGTQFNVYRNDAESTRVSVVEGVVQVSDGVADSNATRLASGDEAEIERGQVVKVPTPDIERAVAWRARQLIFQGARADEIVAEFNRYSKVPIRLEGAALNERRVSGVFDADDPSPLIRFLSLDPEVTVVESEDEIVIRMSR